MGAGIAATMALFGQGEDGAPRRGRAISGHSVGEITAAAAAGVLSAQDAMTFVALQGRGMAHERRGDTDRHERRPGW